MYAGARGLPWPDDELGRLWHACTLLREHRGDGHIAACVTAGLTGLEANLLTEMRVGWEPLAYTATRGRVAGGALTDAGDAVRDAVEQTTDELVQPVVEAIGTELEYVGRLLDGWSQQIVDAGWFPADPYTRASG
jgi:hypothetical protein